MIKATGITRPIDPLGRICLPKELRDNLNLNCDDRVEIFVNDNEEIILKKYQPGCVNCGSTDLHTGLVTKYGIRICKKCFEKA